MTREQAAYASVAAGVAALVVLAFVVAPHACKGGLEIYFWCGVATLLLLFGLPFVTHVGRSVLVRFALAFGFLAIGGGAWLAGMIAANVRFICGLGYL